MTTPRSEMMALDHAARVAETRALERAYPLAKQLVEILELEGFESQRLTALGLRQEIGKLLGERTRGPYPW